MNDQLRKIKASEKDRDFFKIPNEIVDSGLLAIMKPSEIKIYLTIAKFADYKSGRAFPSIALICKLSGMNRNVVCRATERLEYFGVIEKYRAPKAFNYRNVYRVIRRPQINPIIIPQKMEKGSTRPRGKDGKWKSTKLSKKAEGFPRNMETGTYPRKMELHIHPRNMESKEKERELKRDSMKNLGELTKEDEEWIKGKWKQKDE